MRGQVLLGCAPSLNGSSGGAPSGLDPAVRGTSDGAPSRRLIAVGWYGRPEVRRNWAERPGHLEVIASAKGTAVRSSSRLSLAAPPRVNTTANQDTLGLQEGNALMWGASLCCGSRHPCCDTTPCRGVA
jgi:hypothetical protein